MDAGDGAVGGAGFFGEELSLEVFVGVLRKGYAGVSALLGAVVDQAVFADVEIAGAGAAAPVVGLSVGDGFLEVVEAGVILFLEAAHL